MLALQLTVAAAGRILILSSQAQAPVTSEILPNSAYLSLYLDGETFSSTTDSRLFTDSSGNNFTVTNSVGGVRTVLQTAFNPYGEVGLWSEFFESASDGVQINTASSFFTFLNTATSKFTIEGWIFRTTQPVARQVIIDNKNDADSGNGVTVSVASNKLLLTIGNGAASICSAQSISDIPLTWTHFAVTYDQTTATNNAKIYINGVLDSTTNKSATVPGAGGGATIVIANSTSINKPFNKGFISNLRVCNTIVYNSNFTPSTTGLTAISGTQLLVFQDGVLKDNSPNKYTLSQLNRPRVARFSPFGVPIQSSSTVGSAYFDGGVNTALRIQPNNAFAFGTGDFTVECWVLPTEASGGGVTNDRFVFGTFSSSPAMVFALSNSGNKPILWDGTAQRTSSSNLEMQHWSHVAWVRNSGTFKIYVNGKATTSTPHTVNFVSSNELFIGRSNADTTRRFYGHISDLRIVKGTAVYTADFTPPLNPLTAITGTSLLLKCNNASITNKSGDYNPVYLVSTSTTATGIVSAVKKNGLSSIYLNGGTNDYIRMLYSNSSPNSTLNYGRADFTIEFWVNFQTFGSARILYAQDDDTARSGVLIGTNASQTATHLFMSSDGTNWNIASAVTLSPGSTTGTWRHMAVTRSGDTFRTFSNGTLVRTFTSTSAIFETSGRYIHIGGRGGSSNIQGYIDDFRIYRGYAKYTSNFTPE